MASKKVTLSARIRALDGIMRPSEIARRLGTSQTYVRVVLRHRRGGQSKYDAAYTARNRSEILAARRESLKRLYNAVPKVERLAIRKAVYDMHRDVMGSKQQRMTVNTLASRAVIQRGREILSGGGGDGPQS